MLIFNLAFRNVFRHRFRSAITLSSIAFGGIVIIFLNGYFEGTYRSMREGYIEWQTGHLQVAAKGYFEHAGEDPFKYMIDNHEDVKAAIQSWPEVRGVSPRIRTTGLISTRSNSAPCGMEGTLSHTLSPEVFRRARRIPQLNNFHLSDCIIDPGGKGLNPEIPYGIIVGQGLAQALGIRVNDPATLLGVTRSGGLNALDVNVQGIFGTASKMFDDFFIRLPIETAQDLLGTNAVHYLFILLERTEMTPDIKDRLRTLMAKKKWEMEVRDWRELNSIINKTQTLFGRIFVVINVIIALIVVLSISITMNMAVNERVSEIGTLRSLGVKRWKVVRLFLLEGLIVGILGGMAGGVLGTALTLVVQKIGIVMPPPPGMMYPWLLEPVVGPGAVLATFATSASTSVLAALWPSWKAARMDIADALRVNN